MVVAEDMGGYYRVPCDQRDLNYDKYFTEGEQCVSEATDYNSHNTQRLTVPEIKELLINLYELKSEFSA